MRNKKVTVVDYGVGNLLSVIKALDKCGFPVHLTDSETDILNADRLILPGVGAFRDGIDELKKRNIFDAIKYFKNKDRPFLGICLGMQMMLDKSYEFGEYEGLGLIPGKVIEIPKTSLDGEPHKVPHIGWSELFQNSKNIIWDGTILNGISEKSYVYFVHSFFAVPKSDDHILANCNYNSRKMTSMIRSGNMYGCQFHPEKSGLIGLKILENFCYV